MCGRLELNAGTSVFHQLPPTNSDRSSILWRFGTPKFVLYTILPPFPNATGLYPLGPRPGKVRSNQSLTVISKCADAPSCTEANRLIRVSTARYDGSNNVRWRDVRWWWRKYDAQSRRSTPHCHLWFALRRSRDYYVRQLKGNQRLYRRSARV